MSMSHVHAHAHAKTMPMPMFMCPMSMSMSMCHHVPPDRHVSPVVQAGWQREAFLRPKGATPHDWLGVEHGALAGVMKPLSP